MAPFACTVEPVNVVARVVVKQCAVRRRPAPAKCRSVTRCQSANRDNGRTAEASQQPEPQARPNAAARSISPPTQEGDTGTRELRRETFAGKVAILSLGAMLLGERLTGRGIVATLNHDTGVPLWEMEPLLAIGVLALLLVALYPSKTPLLKPGIQGADIYRGAQRLVGRLACLLMAGTIVTEIITGKGALKLFNIETGKETLDEIEIGIAFFALLFMTASPPEELE